MRKLFIFVLIGFLAGCAHNKEITSDIVKDAANIPKGSNVLELRKYNIKVIVNNDLTFMDQIKTSQKTEDIESYMYTYISEGRAKRLMTIEFHKLLCDNCTFAYQGVRAKDGVKLEDGGDHYTISEFNNTSAGKYLINSAVKSGYIVPETVISKTYSYIIDKNNKLKMSVTYYEDLDGSGIDRQSPNKVKINSFLKRALEATKVEAK